MIAVPSEIAQNLIDWKAQWRASVRTLDELLGLLALTPAQVDVDPASAFPLRVPRGFVAQMQRGDPRDPLLLQVLPQAAERLQQVGYSTDPVGDLAAARRPGLLHKYQGRALLVTTGSCAVHCRYCFRRHYPYADQSVHSARLEADVAELAQAGVSEVLLSGGDPLSLDTPKLEQISRALRGVSSLRRLRIHTRLPVVLPARVDAPLLRWLGQLPWPVTVVIHANHPRELGAEQRAALAALKGVTQALLNQAVLLHAINDSAHTLIELSETLFDAGVLPYYLNLLDPVAGSAHFDVDEAAARVLMEALRVRLPGYLVPRLVREVAGAPYKVPVMA